MRGRSILFGAVAAVVFVSGACSAKPGTVINTPPTAVILAAPLQGPAPLLVDFSGELSSDAGGEIVEYQWNLGDGTSSSATVLSHTYTVEGIYVASLTTVDNKGGTDTQTVQVVVNTPPTVTAGSDFTSGVTPFAVNFTSISADPGGSVVGLSWDFGDGGTSALDNPSHTYLAAGSYNATVTVTDNLGSTASDSVAVTVTGNQAPVAAASSDVISGKTPLLVSFDGSGSTDSDDGIASWDWDFGDANFATGATPPAHSYTTAGTYTATLTVTDVLGATDSSSVVITVADNIAPNAAVGLLTASPKTGFAVDFDGTASVDSDGAIVSYAWVFGDGGTGSGANPSHTYSAAGSYLAKLTVTDDNGDTGAKTLRVNVVDNSAPTASASVVTPIPKTGVPVDFDGTASVDADGTIVAWAWDFGDTGTGSTSSPSHTYASAGTYNASVTVTDENGATDISPFVVVVADNVQPTAAFTATPTAGTAPLAVSFDGATSSDSDGSVVAYSWDFGDSTSSTVIAPNHVYTAAGSYTATLTVTDDNGATGIASTVIAVDP